MGAQEPAQAIQARLLHHIRRELAQREGSGQALSFADFMQLALYTPGLGYYAAGAQKLGASGDFVTAPELTPLFGQTLARFQAKMQLEGPVLELGAGSGALAAAFLQGEPRAVYRILELSPELEERQRQRLLGTKAAWLRQLPDSISGLVLANEVLDALPCERVRFADGAYWQAVLRLAEDGQSLRLAWQRLFDGPLWQAAKLRVPPLEGYATEINLQAEALVASVAARLEDGLAIWIDYGFPRREYYLPERNMGTLACHRGHRVHFDPLQDIGLTDLTAHVDFTAMAEAAVEAGAQVACYATQAAFLLDAGLLECLQQADAPTERERYAAIAAVQKLTSPSEMGELFKVLVIGRGECAARAAERLARIDQSFRL